MAGNAINAKSDELSSEQLDAVSGGLFNFGGWASLLRAVASQQEIGVGQCYGGPSGQNDPAQMFGQIMQQLTGG